MSAASAPATAHWHCYQWFGPGKELLDRAKRDPIINEREFLSSRLPASLLRDELKRGPRAVASTCATPEEAFDWAETQYRSIEDSLIQPPVLFPEFAHRAPYTVPSLHRGQDVAWGFWTKSATLLSLVILACDGGRGACPTTARAT